ncbi:MAG: GNAT family N-acetyltransferase [Lachnospiraceae bacterium]|nr:GNAT family N-acetyltransferase [Lachnospiraceae bacterium]
MKISKDIYDKAYAQFKLDCNIDNSVKINDHIFIAPTKLSPGMRIHEKCDLFFRVVSFYGNVYIMADAETIPGWTDIFKDEEADWFFSYGNLRKIDYILKEYDREILDTHIYYLPDEDFEDRAPLNQVKYYDEKEIALIKDKNPFHNALCYSKTQPDVIAVSSFESEKEIAMAGASRDGEYLYQIGIDVLPEYRGRGLAVSLVTELKQHLLSEGKTPFYGTSEGHSLSRMVGVKSGFIPAFSELLVCKK